MIRSVVALLAIVASTAAGPNRQADAVKVTGDVGTPVHLTMDQLAKYKSVRVPMRDHDGSVIKYEGPLVSDILKDAGVEAGQHPGKAVAIYVSAVASDGYEVVFGLGELTPSISGHNIILATRGEGKPLGENLGPLRIVVEGDKVQARCIRMVNELRVGRLRK